MDVRMELCRRTSVWEWPRKPIDSWFAGPFPLPRLQSTPEPDVSADARSNRLQWDLVDHCSMADTILRYCVHDGERFD